MYRVENMEKEINQFTGGKIAAKTVWVDRKGKELEMSQIDDDYLFNICQNKHIHRKHRKMHIQSLHNLIMGIFCA